MVDHKHAPPKPPVKDSYPAKSPSHPAANAPPNHPAGAPPRQQHTSKASDPVPNRDPDEVEPLVRPTETLPTDVHAGQPSRGEEPVGLARHAETQEEVDKLNIMEHSKIPPPGSRHYTAGQPVNEEEYDRTEREANRLADAGRAQRTEAEQRMAERTPGDPDYHPSDPDKRDTPQAQSPPKDRENDVSRR